MSFSMSFSNVLRRTIGQNIFGKSYNTLLGFGIIIKVDILKCNGQWPRLMHVLVMLTMLNGYLLLSTTTWRYLQETWLGPRVDKLLYFLIEFLNSLFKKFSYSDKNFKGISSNGHIFTWQFCAKLNVWWSACYKSSSLVEGYLLYWRALVAGSLYFLTQFMRFQNLLFLNAISWIFSLKKMYLIFLTNFLNFFQSSSDLKD